VLLTLNHPEGNLNFVPMIVRLLQLMMLDILYHRLPIES